MAKILIIGGGVAGLSAGIYARMAGHEATIVEKHVIPGGNLTGWSREGYHIDNCIHWLTGTNPASELHKIWLQLGALGNGVGVLQGESLFTCERDGVRVSLPPSVEGLRQQMLAASEGDEAEIRRFIRAIELIGAFDHVAGKDKNRGVTPTRLIRGIGPLLKYYTLTTGQLAKRFNSPALNCFITGFWGDDFSAFALIYVFATYCHGNGALPEGGSLKMAMRIADRFKSLGGRLILGREVTEISIDNGRASSVILSDGSREEADYVILTTEPASAFGSMVELSMPEGLKKQYDDPKLRRFSAFQCAFACDSEELPFRGDLIFDVPSEYVECLGTKQLIIREFSHEQGFAPKGKNIIQTLTFCFDGAAEYFVKLKDSGEEIYRKKKEELSALVKRLIEQHCPTLCGKLHLVDVWTPASYKRYVGSEIGSFMSFAIPEKHLPIPLSPVVPGCDNLILATQWLQSPGGLPIAAKSGIEAIKRIVKMEKKK